MGTAGDAGRNIDRDTKTTMITFLANGKHLFLNQAETEKMLARLDIRRRKSGNYYGYVKDDR